ncbi:MAG: alpha/beta hydrolase [Solirubrobacterales bacterium]|nr:alpha/beta hydrolase [Solirubrobacterales bacterium]
MSQETVELPQGTVAYRDEGEGPVLLFSHGIFVDSSLWDGLVERLAPAGFRCVRPETPMGAHRIPLNPDTELSPPKVADLLADFIDALDLGPVTVVGSDSGGAVAQMLAAQHPEKVAAIVLNNCDALDVYPPFPYNALPPLARVPGSIATLGLLSKLKPIRWATYRALTADPIPDRQLKKWLEPTGSDPAIRRDAKKVIGGLEKNQAIEAAEKLRHFEKPVLLAWGTGDRFFKLELAERLAAMIPNARIAEIEGGKTFVALDNPDEVADLITDFARNTAGILIQ